MTPRSRRAWPRARAASRRSRPRSCARRSRAHAHPGDSGSARGSRGSSWAVTLEGFADLLQERPREPAGLAHQTVRLEREQEEAVFVELPEQQLVTAEHEQELVELAVARPVE